MSEQQTVQKQKKKKKKRLVTVQSAPRILEPEAPTILMGPFGLWRFPIINWLLSISGTLRARAPATTGLPRQIFPKTASRRIEYIRDAQGRIIEKYEEVEIG